MWIVFWGDVNVYVCTYEHIFVKTYLQNKLIYIWIYNFCSINLYIYLYIFLYIYLFMYLCIQGVFHNNLPGFSGFRFRRKLARTKNQQGTDTVIKHNGRRVISHSLVLLTRASTGVVSTSYYIIYPLFV